MITHTRKPIGGGAVISAKELAMLAASAHLLSLSPPRRRTSPHHGPHSTRHNGRGLEYAESRRYSAGDDARGIDWRVTARSGDLHSKLFHDERERPVLLVVDGGATMRFGTQRAFKSVAAAEAAALIAFATLAAGDRVGGVLAAPSGHLALRPQRGGGRHLLRGLASLTDDSLGGGALSLSEALRRARYLGTTGAHVFVFSDVDGIGTALPAIETLNHRCEVTVVSISDPLERELPTPLHPLPITDGTTTSDLSTLTTRQRQQFVEEYNSRRAEVEHRCSRRCIDRIELSTADDPSLILPHRVRSKRAAS